MCKSRRLKQNGLKIGRLLKKNGPGFGMIRMEKGFGAVQRNVPELFQIPGAHRIGSLSWILSPGRMQTAGQKKTICTQK